MVLKKKSSAKKKVVKKKKIVVKKSKTIKKTKKTAKKAVKRSSSKKAVVIQPAEMPWRIPLDGEKYIGAVDDYYQHVGVIALFIKEDLKLGDRIHVRGFATDFTQIVSSIQIEHQPVEKASKGAGVGIKVDQKAHKGNFVYKIIG